ncbi:MAG: SEC-C domain-containing protein, partial [Candidatus Dormibacteraeota bacterium]|nr:SEC-C domain-containing protein [Candidatus Dormibacteraeota bacterium]
MKVGRNDPCPCGSGRKFKNCHQRSAAESSSAEELWRRIHELCARLQMELLQFVDSRYGRQLLDEAWRQFTLFEAMTLDLESIQMPVFMPWFFYEWNPDPHETVLPSAEAAGFTVASAYLSRRGRYQDPLTVRYLKACRDSAFSFLDVLEVSPGSAFTARDALTRWEGAVIEKTASRTLQRGDIIFAKAVTVDGVTVLEGCAPFAFPPLAKTSIIELRNRIRKVSPTVTADVIKAHRDEVLDIYHSTTDRVLNPKMPSVTNTDGDPLMFCRVRYEVPSARGAFDALRHLSHADTEAQLLADATFDEAGELRSVEIPWSREVDDAPAWKNISLGNIEIDGQRLVAEVNSEARASEFRQIADKALPAGSRHLSTVLEPLEAAMEADEGDDMEAPQDDFEETPEAEALIKAHVRA